MLTEAINLSWQGTHFPCHLRWLRSWSRIYLADLCVKIQNLRVNFFSFDTKCVSFNLPFLYLYLPIYLANVEFRNQRRSVRLQQPEFQIQNIASKSTEKMFQFFLLKFAAENGVKSFSFQQVFFATFSILYSVRVKSNTKGISNIKIMFS